jgi:hypothetical protein
MGRSRAVIHQPMQSLVAMKSFGYQVLLPSFLKQMFLETEKLQQDDVHDIQTIGIFVCFKPLPRFGQDTAQSIAVRPSLSNTHVSASSSSVISVIFKVTQSH